MTKVSPKVTAGGVTGAAVAVLVWLASLVGLDIPAEVQAALLVVLPIAEGYLAPDRLRDLGLLHPTSTYTPKHGADSAK